MFDVPGSRAWMGMIRNKQEALDIPGPINQSISIWVCIKRRICMKAFDLI